jgi:hypothetical protein
VELNTMEQDQNVARNKRITRPAYRWLAGTLMLAGGITAGSFALNHGGTSGVAASASTALANANVANSAQSPQQTMRGGMGDMGGFGGHGFGGGFGGLTVTGVSGNTITATRGGTTVTIAVSGTTTITEAGATVGIGAIQTGERISVQGSSTGTNAYAATAIAIIRPSENGVITAASGSQLTITSDDGSVHIINLESGTRYQKAGSTDTASDVTTGKAITATGPVNSDGSLNADLIIVEVPSVAGQVSALANGSFTLTGRGNNGTVTVTPTANVVYVNADGSAATAASVTNGANVLAQGTLSLDGKTLSALRITILPANAGHGLGGGRFQLGGTGGFGSATTPNSGTNSSAGPGI